MCAAFPLESKRKTFQQRGTRSSCGHGAPGWGPLGLVWLLRCTPSESGTSGSVRGLSEPTYGSAVLGVGGGSKGHVLPLCPVFQGGLINQINE